MITSSGFSRTDSASGEIRTPQGASGAPIASPSSRPALAGSLSIAPTISRESFWRIRRTMEEPMGPRPYCTTRIFFFTMEFLSEARSQYVKGLGGGLQPNLPCALSRGAQCLRTAASNTHGIALGQCAVEYLE